MPSYRVLEQRGLNIVQKFRRSASGARSIHRREWTVDLAGWTKSALQLHTAAGAAALLGIYAFTMRSVRRRA